LTEDDWHHVEYRPAFSLGKVARSWVILAWWLGLMSVAVTSTYYLFKTPSDFGPGLKLFQPEKPVWALRVGGASCERPELV
jgi:hypothetical protein